MKRSKKSIADKILIYLIIFSAVLLIFLYIFQISFLNIYYESYRTKQLKVIMNDLNKNYNNDNYKQYFEDISLNNDVCIELVVGNNIEYSSSIRNRKRSDFVGMIVYTIDFWSLFLNMVLKVNIKSIHFSIDISSSKVHEMLLSMSVDIPFSFVDSYVQVNNMKTSSNLGVTYEHVEITR